MSNPILTSKLYQNTGELKELIAELELVQKRLMELRNQEVKNAKVLEVAVKKVAVGTSDQREELDRSAKQADEIAKKYKKYNDSLGQNGKRLAALKEAQRQINNVNKLEAKLLTSKEGSYNRLSAQYSLNKIRLNQMTVAERENTKEGKKLVKQTNDIFQEMKRLQEVTGKTSLNVGNYEEAIRNADAASGGFIGSIKGMGKSLKALLANPVVLFVTLLVGALTALVNAFGRSEKGARLLEKGTALVSAGMSVLVELSVAAVEGIENVFGKTSESKIGKFAKILKDVVISRLRGIVNTLGFMGESISALADGDFKRMKDAGVNAAASINQAITGIQLGDDSDLVKGIDNVIDKVEKKVVVFDKLRISRIGVQRANRGLTKTVENLTTEEAKLLSIVDDGTKSFKEREDAAKKAREITESKNKIEVRIAKNNLSLINSEIDIRKKAGEDVERLLDSQLQLYSSLRQAERELTLSVIDNERKRNKLKQDRLERDLDILIDGFDNQKTINEKLIRDENLTFEKRREILDKTNRLSDDSFLKQIETIQKFTGVSINANELIGESDAIVLNQKIRNLGLSEIIEGRLLEIVRDRKTANQDLAESEQDLNNAIKKSQEEQIKFRKKLFEDSKKAAKELKDNLRNAALSGFEQQQELAKSEFDLLKSTEEEKTRFKLNAEKDRLNSIISINKLFGEELTKVQLQTLKNQVKKIDQEISGLNSKEVNDIYDLFGFNISDEKKEAVGEAIGFVKDQYGALLDERVKLANQAVEASNTEVEQAQASLQIEREKLLAGEANRAQSAQRDLEQAEKIQERALKAQEKAQKAKQRLDTIEQASGLVTASVNIYESFTSAFGAAGPILAVGAIAAMFGTFIASKIKANKLTKKTFGKGTYEVLSGGSHQSGNDIGLGMMDERTERRAEGGEGMAIFSKKYTKKYKDVLPDFVKAINTGTFEEMFMRKNMIGDNVSSFVLMGGNERKVDMKRSEKLLEKIGRNTSGGVIIDGRGKLIERKGNLKTEYV